MTGDCNSTDGKRPETKSEDRYRKHIARESGMKQWIKKYKNVLIGSIVILAVLTAAFLFGGTKTKPSDTSAGDAAVVTEDIQSSDASIENITKDVAGTTEENSAKDSGDSSGRTDSDKTTGRDSGSSSSQTTAAGNPATGAEAGTTIEDTAEGRTEAATGTTTEAAATGGASSEAATEAPSITFSCTISISCANILNHMDAFDSSKADLLPADGVILAATTVTVTEGETVYDVLRRTCTNAGITLDASITPATGSAYVRGIHNIYEFDCGSLSGWKYSVNGTYSNYGCSAYTLKAGDNIQWIYSCDMNE